MPACVSSCNLHICCEALLLECCSLTSTWLTPLFYLGLLLKCHLKVFPYQPLKVELYSFVELLALYLGMGPYLEIGLLQI